MNKKKTWFFRISAVLVLVVIAAVMLIIGRGHTVYFDSKQIEYNGTTVETPYKIEVIVNGKKVAKLYDDERGMTSWIGQNFEMTLQVTAEKGGDSKVYNVGLSLPYNMDGVILNIPALLAGLPEEAYLSEFVQEIPEASEDEEVVTDEMNDMGDF